jgi:hypothetical protein
MFSPSRTLAVLSAAPMIAVCLTGVAAAAQQAMSGPAADRRLPWTLERRWSAGGEDDDFLQIERVWDKDVAPGPDGSLFVVDRTANRVVQYDAAGKVLRTFGQSGAGPGEVKAPLSVSVGSDGAIHVYDAEKRAFVSFAADGRILPERRRPPRLRAVRQLANGKVIAETISGDTVRLAIVTETARDEFRHVVEMPTRSTPPVCHVTDYPVSPVFAPTLIWSFLGTTVVAASGRFEIDLIEDGRFVRRFTRARELRRSTPALGRQHIGPGETFQIIGMPPCTVPAEMILKVAEVAKEIPAYQSLAIAPDRRIWATRFAVRGEEAFADIYDLAKGYEGTVRLGAVRPVAFLSNGDLVSIEGEWQDEIRLVVYGIRGRD